MARAIDRLSLTGAERKRCEDQWRKLDENNLSISKSCWVKVKKLLEECQITKERDYDLDDVHKIQQHLDGQYQLIVVNEEHDSQPIYSGKWVDRERIIGLSYANGHFETIFSLPAYLGCRFYCTLCDTKHASERLHYKCPLKCRKCLQDGCSTVGSMSIRCNNCGVIFEQHECFANHLKQGISNHGTISIVLGPNGGRSRCQNTKVCKKCQQSYYTDHGIQHFCGKAYCNACKSPQTPGHTHFLSSLEEPKKITEKRIFFDLEVSLINLFLTFFRL